MTSIRLSPASNPPVRRRSQHSSDSANWRHLPTAITPEVPEESPQMRKLLNRTYGRAKIEFRWSKSAFEWVASPSWDCLVFSKRSPSSTRLWFGLVQEEKPLC